MNNSWVKNMRAVFRSVINQDKDLFNKYYDLSSIDKVILLEATIIEIADNLEKASEMKIKLKQNMRIQELNKQ